MTDLKQPASSSRLDQSDLMGKTPIAVNPFNRAKDLEDDPVGFKVDSPQVQKDSKQKVVHSQQPSQDKPTLTTAIPGATTYDPYTDLQKGKGEEEVINKLKDENTKLRKELKSISDDLTVLLEKKKTKKTYRTGQYVKDIVSNAGVSETGLRSELEGVQKQIDMYQKELDKLKGKYAAQATYERYEELQDSLHTTEARIQETVAQKRNLEKTLREKEKTLDVIYADADVNQKLKSLTEEVRLNRERVRDAERKREMLEAQIPKRKEYTQNLVKEIQNLQKEFQRVQQKTGYQHKEVKSKPDLASSQSRAASERLTSMSRKVPLSKPVEEEVLEFNEENFAKLQKELKVLQKAEKVRGDKNDKELEALREQLNQLERNDIGQKMAEKEKEIALLTTKTKEISRIVRHQAVAPLQKEEEYNAKELSLATKEDARSPLTKKEGSSSPTKNRSSSKAKKEPVQAKRPQPYHLLVQYAKQNFQSKGYRKDERGKPVGEDEGENFNDKDLVGKQKVKIIAIDIWYDDQKITGIQAVYENEKGEIIEGGPHVANPDKSKMVTFETLEEDYLKEISGFMNKAETLIECLIMKTFRGEIMKVGQPTKDSKQFNFDINELEHPAILYGSVKEDEHGNGRLTRLGVLISSHPIEEKIKTEGADEKLKTEGEKEGNDEKSESKKDVQEEIAEEEGDGHASTTRKSRQNKGNHEEREDQEEQEELEDQEEQSESKKVSSRAGDDDGEGSYRVGKVIN